MKFTNLRLVGFKSFVETTDFDIRDGLTGVVGPNGCGKSNLLEALRWVMGATSAKALRGEGMSDVIFSGTSMRPSRNWAEVILTLDNSDRSAPAEYNNSETIEVSRRILRRDEGTQSIYRINAHEVRAKDVQLLFADASTGANSPALVRQGQVAELISAKPQNRRRLLEEAAGITGLHSRRHEAELRLRAAGQNLERLEDVTGELESQKTALARQARQATRYRNISGDIRRAEAMAAFLRWRDACEARDEADEKLGEISGLIEETARAAAAAATAQAAAHEALDPLRMAETQAAAALHRLTVAREGLDEEAERASAELARLAGELDRLRSDVAREKDLLRDAEEAVEALTHEEEGLKTREGAEAARLEAARVAMNEAASAVEEAERIHEEKSAQSAELDARRRSVNASIEDLGRRGEKITTQIAALGAEKTDITPTADEAAALADATARFNAAEENSRNAEAAHHRAEEERSSAEEKELSLRGPRQKAENSLSEIKAECDALERVLDAQADGDWPPLIAQVDVAPGYENALAAALGDDLSASLDSDAPAHWSIAHGADDLPGLRALPGGAAPLSRFVKAPPQLSARLSMIGVVARELGEQLQSSLAPGQRLVTREGDLWRWDGFVARAEAKTSAAIRLEQTNRLIALGGDVETATRRAEEAARIHDGAVSNLETRQQDERQARTLFTDARRAIDDARTMLSALAREHERVSTRLGSINEAIALAEENAGEYANALNAQRAEKSALTDPAIIAEGLAQTRETVSKARARATEARAAFGDLSRESDMRNHRLEELARERGVWRTRRQTAGGRIDELRARIATAENSQAVAAQAPEIIEKKRTALLDQLGAVEARRAEAGDELANAVAKAQGTDKIARDADTAAAQAREARARLEAQGESAIARVEEAAALAQETCSAAPAELLAIAAHKAATDLPEREAIDAKLERYKRERENLGGVNLRADEEMREVSTRLEEISVEREDCEGAIRKLRAAIGGLNREARQRLLAAFDTVNNNFSALFTRLFNGGQAELRLIDSEDVLEAGLEIFASPPGKKLTSMSLMSGGEQALTATALIFAVFMANPAPVCVLDEVDAPLDDANVERFCRMLNEMAAETDTRFIIITHHALTMSRMDRLYGVTMIERGVSQMVSVDLVRAEQLAAE